MTGITVRQRQGMPLPEAEYHDRFVWTTHRNRAC